MKFHEMTFPELRQVPRSRVVVIAPIAACEQHSHHLAVFTDTVLCTGVAEGVEKQLSREVLLLPTQWWGASHHHLRFGATLSADVDTHEQMIVELLKPLLDDGYERILVLNGHGGNIDTMQMAMRRLRMDYPQRIVCAASYWEIAARELAELAEGPRKQMGHACEFETSMLMCLRPDLVRKDKIRNDPLAEDPALRGIFLGEDMYQRTDHGCVGYPELATPEKGKVFLEAAVNRTVEAVRALLERPLPK